MNQSAKRCRKVAERYLIQESKERQVRILQLPALEMLKRNARW